jgi:Signal peptidase, peptidase S26
MCADPIRRRTRILVVAMLFLAAAAVAIPISERHPLLLYNASGSAPIGFYRIENRSPERGETAVVRPSATLENLLSTHRLLPLNVPLLKRVIGLGGDHLPVGRGHFRQRKGPGRDARPGCRRPSLAGMEWVFHPLPRPVFPPATTSLFVQQPVLWAGQRMPDHRRRAPFVDVESKRMRRGTPLNNNTIGRMSKQRRGRDGRAR